MTYSLLVCDDTVEIRDYLRFEIDRDPALEMVAEAANGREAVDLAAEVRPDVILLDIAMPVMDGTKALPLIRSVSPNSKVIVLSGFTVDDDMARAVLDAGADRYVEKGTSLRGIMNVVRDVCGVPPEPASPSFPRETERRLFERSKDLLCIADSAGYFLHLSPSWESVVGWSLSELKGRPFLEFVHPEDRGATAAEAAALQTGVDTVDFENRYRCKDGSYRWLSWTTTASSGPGGLLYARARDVSVEKTERFAREEAEAASARSYEQLEQSEERFRSLVQNSRDVIAVIDQDGICTYVSPTVADVTGFRPEEAVGVSGFEFLHPDEVGDIAVQFAALVADPGATKTVEARTRTADGGWVWIEIRAANRLDDPAINGLVLNYHDISERKRMESEIREREALFSGAFDAAQTGIALIDGDGRTYVDVNQALCDMLGYSKEELLSLDWVSITHPDDLPSNIEKIADMLSGKRDLLSINKRYIRKDGRSISVEVADSIVRDADRKPLYLVAHITDVTEREDAAKALRESEELLQAVVNNSPALIFIKDRQGRYLLVNDHALEVRGIGREAVLGQTVFDVFPEDVAELIDAMDRSVFAELAPIEVEEKAPDHRGDMRTYLSVKFPLFNRSGECYALCGISTDITDRARADEERDRLQRQLRQAQKMEAVGQLAGGIAHDFNNILAVILNYAEFVREDTSDDDPRVEDVQEIIEAGQRAATLVHKLLAFSRKEIVSKVVVDLNDVIGGMQELLTRTIGEDIGLVLELGDDPPVVEADPGQLEQILLNLAVNARDAMRGGGRLVLATATTSLADSERAGLPAGLYSTLSVTDTGAGMDPEVAERIFEPFFTTKPRGEGTGLGLATVYGIVKQSGGGIYVDSAPGSGTSFSIFLPVTDRRRQRSQVANPPLPGMSRKASVLVVEDEEKVRGLVERILAKEGFEVVAVPGGIQALEHLDSRDRPLDVLLTDVIMPEMSGKKLAEEVGRRSPRTKAVYMSGYTDDVIAQRGVLDGGDHLIKKPFNAQRLVTALRDILDEAVV